MPIIAGPRRPCGRRAEETILAVVEHLDEKRRLRHERAQPTASPSSEPERIAAALAGTESLGLVMAGIAHEIATPVGIGLTAASQLEHAAHEIRQRLDADALTRAELEALLDEVAETGRIITNNLAHAAELMRSFKEVSVDQIGDDLRTIDLVDYLRDILTNLGPRLRATPHKILLDCPGAVTLTTCPGALTQIVTNLVMNSLTHAFSAGRAGTLDLSAWRDGEDVLITYGDDGVGVPPAIMSRLFEPGFTTRRGKGGTGLGLGIVHDLVTRKLGGTMTARNRPHGGLAFDIRLPADSPR